MLHVLQVLPEEEAGVVDEAVVVAVNVNLLFQEVMDAIFLLSLIVFLMLGDLLLLIAMVLLHEQLLLNHPKTLKMMFSLVFLGLCMISV